jgi:hypothetical protein
VAELLELLAAQSIVTPGNHRKAAMRLNWMIRVTIPFSVPKVQWIMDDAHSFLGQVRPLRLASIGEEVLVSCTERYSKRVLPLQAANGDSGSAEPVFTRDGRENERMIQTGPPASCGRPSGGGEI